MRLNKKLLGLAVGVALASTSAFAAQNFADNTGRGSLLIFPRIDISNGNDTLITIVSDYDGDADVRIKCYYVAPGSAYNVKKKVRDFTFTMTHNHPTYWWVSKGGNGAPKFSPFPSNQGTVDRGELKCWAIDSSLNGNGGEIHFNFLSGTASIVNDNGQASEYSAFTFQALEGGTGKANAFKVLSSPGVLNLDNAEYEACPSQLLGTFLPGYSAKDTVSEADLQIGKLESTNTKLTVAGCIEDLTQDRGPVYTKLNYTFWNQREESLTGNYECMDSWYETNFDRIADATYANLGTRVAYFRVYAEPSTVCGSIAKQVTPGIIGVKQEWTTRWSLVPKDVDPSGLKSEQRDMRGTNLTGRGTQIGVINFDLQNNNGAQ